VKSLVMFKFLPKYVARIEELEGKVKELEG